VTGASRGIGFATARELSSSGVRVALVSRNVKMLNIAANTLQKAGGDVIAVPCDVTDFNAFQKATERIITHYHAVDILINNAALAEPVGTLIEVDANSWSYAISVNLIGVFNACKAVLNQMIMQQSGVIINISSGLADFPLPGASAYCASKAGLTMLTKTMALELVGSGVNIFGFRPNMVDTDMQTFVRRSILNQRIQFDKIELGDPRNTARAITYLCATENYGRVGEDLDEDEIALVTKT
jgi:NAD(P)-dependent dehydrogenase (short-subunit alcohol dehydrogenase family)